MIIKDKVEAAKRNPYNYNIVEGKKVFDEKSIDKNLLATQAENDIENIIGFSEKIFSFPSSQSNIDHYKILESMNFQYAISDKFKIYDNKDVFQQEKYHLGRYCFTRRKNLDWQIKLCMSNFSPYLLFSKLL